MGKVGETALTVRLGPKAPRRNGEHNDLLNFYKLSGKLWSEKTMEGDFVFGLGDARIVVKPIGKQAIGALKDLEPGKKYVLTVGILAGHTIIRNREPHQVVLMDIRKS